MGHKITDAEYVKILGDAQQYCENFEVFQMFVVARRNGFEYRRQGFISSALIYEQSADNYYSLLSEDDKEYAEQAEQFLEDYFFGLRV